MRAMGPPASYFFLAVVFLAVVFLAGAFFAAAFLVAICLFLSPAQPAFGATTYLTHSFLPCNYILRATG